MGVSLVSLVRGVLWMDTDAHFATPGWSRGEDVCHDEQLAPRGVALLAIRRPIDRARLLGAVVCSGILVKPDTRSRTRAIVHTSG